MLFDVGKFLSAYTRAFGALSASQRESLEFLLGKIQYDGNWPADLRQVAYFLATIGHETAHTFKPVKEIRERADSPRRKNQDRYWIPGEYGRGYVQITWDRNYRKFGLRPDERDKALEPDTAYRIAADGMRKGLFTGRKLSDYFTPTTADYTNARRIINGLDRAQIIAQSAQKLQACLSIALLRDTSSVASGTERGAEGSNNSAPAFSSPLSAEAASPGLLARLGTARAAYAGTSESEKSLAARVLQFGWVGLSGLIAILQKHPTETAVAVIVLLTGFYVLHTYVRRQDKKTLLKLQAQGG